jgi:(1->4)-alpha-D-glucan 1-alpha-D-glucosylmutase
VADDGGSVRRVPRATYRVQLHPGFTFDDAASIADYLAALGVSHLYCSPYLQAAAGSTHGYDVVDHGRLSDDLGGEPAFRRLVGALSGAGLHQVLDVVPNHMAVDGAANRWWWDVLENGPSSLWAGFFDIDWESPDKVGGTVLVPVLGDHYGRVLEAGELRVERRGGAFVVRHHEHELPLSPRTLDDLVARAASMADSPALAETAVALGRLPHARVTDPQAVAERHRQKEVLRERLARLSAAEPHVEAALGRAVAALNADHDALDALLRRQNYRLAFWRTASEQLDYRRFFNIETLIGLRMEEPRVFEATHRLILELVRKDVVHGLRLDHVDGLREPEAYLGRLRAATGDVWTVAEKILAPDEDLVETWPIDGTTGYEFLNRVNGLFVDGANEAALTACYARFAGTDVSYADVLHDSKLHILEHELAAETERMTRALAGVCEAHRRHRDHNHRDLADVVREVVAAFSVYRTYVVPGRPARAFDRTRVTEAVERVATRRPEIDAELLAFVRALLLLEHPGRPESDLALRMQQLTAAVMAKGAEDTAFYRYHRLISLNEVGGDPGTFGRPPERFHRESAAVAERWPATLLTLSTHDTKRSADVRARIDLLSEIPRAWEDAVGRWTETNAAHRRDELPDRNVEYLLYQTLVGAWPIDAERMVAFLRKAVREAKVHTSWTNPAAEYEDAVETFARGLLADGRFRAHLEAFLGAHRLRELGHVVSLAQTTLLLTCPGVPDVYQGTELWDGSLVDPDNRRPVDYAHRRRLLSELATHAAPPGDDDAGRAKLWLIQRLLAHRRAVPEAYEARAYEPLDVRGAKAHHAVAFRRERLVVVVPRLVVGLDGTWGDTHAALPAGRWRSVLTGAELRGGMVRLDELLHEFPAAVLAREGA